MAKDPSQIFEQVVDQTVVDQTEPGCRQLREMHVYLGWCHLELPAGVLLGYSCAYVPAVEEIDELAVGVVGLWVDSFFGHLEEKIE